MALTAILAAVLAAESRGVVIPLWSADLALQIVAQLALLLIQCLLCSTVFAKALGALRRRRFCGELLIVCAAAVAAGDCLFALAGSGRQAAAPYVLPACAALAAGQWGLCRESRAQADTCRAAAITAEPPYLVTNTPGGACKQRGRVEGFYTDLTGDDLPLLYQTALGPVILMGTLVFAGLGSLGQGRGGDFLLYWSAILTASAALSLPLAWPLPWSRLSRQLQKDGCAVAGWKGAEAVSRKKAMIVTDLDLFPPGAVHLNGAKLYGEELPHAVSYAASMARSAGSGLEWLFDNQLRSEGGRYYEVSDFSFYEEGGYSGSIHGESVLLGTASFMRKMDIRLPANLNLRTGLYLAVDRQLTAVFAVKYNASENVDWALRLLKRNRITLILAGRDPNITPALLKRKFAKVGRLQYPSLADRVALSEQEEGRGRPRALLLREGLLPYAETVIGSRRLCGSVRGCMLLSLLASASGCLLAFYLTFRGYIAMMPPLTLLVFLLLWAVPVVLLSGWSGHR